MNDHARTNGAGPSPRRTMGLWMATALVVGNMIGSGVFLLPASLAGDRGPGVAARLGLHRRRRVLLALVFANLGRAFPRTGGPYAYARRAFGDFVGFQTAWGYWIAVWAGNAAIAVAFVGYLARVLAASSASNKLLGALVGIALDLAADAHQHPRRPRERPVQVVTTVLKFVPLAVIGIVGLFFIDGGNYDAVRARRARASALLTAAAALTLWAFIGLESATVPADEVKDPERTIPRATIIGTVVATVRLHRRDRRDHGHHPDGRSSPQSTSPFADAAGVIFGGGWDKVIAVVALISTFGALNGWILLQGRVPLAAAEDGLFPAAFARVHGERRTPVFGLVVSSRAGHAR